MLTPRRSPKTVRTARRISSFKRRSSRKRRTTRSKIRSSPNSSQARLPTECRPFPIHRCAFPPWPATCISQPVRWTPGGTSSDIEDRRGEGGGGGFGFGGGGFGGLHLGIGGTLLLLIISFVFKVNL